MNLSQFIIDAITLEDTDLKQGSNYEKLNSFVTNFKSEYDTPYRRQRYKTIDRLFVEYCKGLASTIHLPVYPNEIDAVISSFVEFDSIDRSKDVQEQFLLIVSYRLKAICKEYGITNYC